MRRGPGSPGEHGGVRGSAEGPGISESGERARTSSWGWDPGDAPPWTPGLRPGGNVGRDAPPSPAPRAGGAGRVGGRDLWASGE